jgi:hypothetical protein
MRPYACPECGGSGETSCPCCESTLKCPRCRESGLDPAKVDIDAVEAEVRRKRGPTSQWNLIDDGQHVGYCGVYQVGTRTWTVKFKDFPPKAAGGGGS